MEVDGRRDAHDRRQQPTAITVHTVLETAVHVREQKGHGQGTQYVPTGPARYVYETGNGSSNYRWVLKVWCIILVLISVKSMKRHASTMQGPPIKRTKCFCLPVSNKRSAPPMMSNAKRLCVRNEPTPPSQGDPFVHQLLAYIQSLEQRIAALERCQPSPAEPFACQSGIVVF